MRLLPGWLAFQQGRSFALDGDASIRRRPVDRIAEPLRAMGAVIEAARGPLPAVHRPRRGARRDRLRAAGGERPGQVVRAAGRARDRRDHGDRAGRRAAITPSGCWHQPAPRSAREGSVDAGYRTTIGNTDELELEQVDVPGRPVVGGVPDRRRRARPGLTARARGRRGQLDPGRLPADPRADGRDRALGVPSRRARSRRTSRWRTSTSAARRSSATAVEADEVPLAIDELPLVALLGCFAEGETVVRGAEELRVKESDRIAAVVEGLRGLGGQIEALPDGFVVTGTGRLRGGAIDALRRPPAGAARRGSRAGVRGGRRGGRDGGGRRVLSRLRRGSGAGRRRDGRGDRRSGGRREIDGRAGGRRRARLHLPGHRRDVPRGGAGRDRARRRAGEIAESLDGASPASGRCSTGAT